MGQPKPTGKRKTRRGPQKTNSVWEDKILVTRRWYANRNKTQFLFELSAEYIEELFESQNGKCAVSGLSLTVDKYWLPHTARLDRIDRNFGYVEGNVRWIHKHIPQIKRGMADEYFYAMCAKIADYNGTATSLLTYNQERMLSEDASELNES